MPRSSSAITHGTRSRRAAGGLAAASAARLPLRIGEKRACGPGREAQQRWSCSVELHEHDAARQHSSVAHPGRSAEGAPGVLERLLEHCGGAGTGGGGHDRTLRHPTATPERAADSERMAARPIAGVEPLHPQPAGPQPPRDARRRELHRDGPQRRQRPADPGPALGPLPPQPPSTTASTLPGRSRVANAFRSACGRHASVGDQDRVGWPDRARVDLHPRLAQQIREARIAVNLDPRARGWQSRPHPSMPGLGTAAARPHGPSGHVRGASPGHRRA